MNTAPAIAPDSRSTTNTELTYTQRLRKQMDRQLVLIEASDAPTKTDLEILQKLTALYQAQPQADRLADLLPLLDAFAAHIEAQHPEALAALEPAFNSFTASFGHGA